MKRFVACVAFSLIATTASATLYQNSTTTDVGTAANSVATTLWTTSIPASAISASQAMRVHLSLYSGDGSGYVEVKLGSVSLGFFDTDNVQMDADILVTRLSGSNLAAFTGTITYHGASPSVVEITPSYGSGVSWGSAQNLQIIGTNSSPFGGGLHIESGGVQR
ncbi:MAG TPA: hypothetical protein VN634_11470 [Candidatus Limnocylindrales bacterium]|nr:hypothetical protein [Candidatus Limnocylindrales bacterium]